MPSNGLSLRLYVQPAYPAEKALPTVRKVAESVGPYQGKPLAPWPTTKPFLEAERDDWFESGTRFLSYYVPSMAEDGLFSAGFAQLHDAANNTASINADVGIEPYDAHGVARSLELLQHMAPAMIASSGARVAMINGIGDFPGLEEVPARGIPWLLTPWNWFAEGSLSREQRAKLEALPWASVEKFAGGTLYRATPELTKKPPAAFIAAVKATGDLRYKQSSLPS